MFFGKGNTALTGYTNTLETRLLFGWYKGLNIRLRDLKLCMVPLYYAKLNRLDFSVNSI